MNGTVEKRVDRFEELAKQIISDMECILDDVVNFEGYDELFTIESAFTRAMRSAELGYNLARDTYDELEEEKGEENA